MQESEQELIELARTGDGKAVASLVAGYSPEVYRICRYLLSSGEEARDAASDIFVKLYTSPRGIPAEGFRAWLIRVTYNHCRDMLRRRSTFTRILPRIYARNNEKELPGPEEEVIANDERREVQQALDMLSGDERAVIMLRYYQQLSYAEISDVLGVPSNTVASRLHRAREKVRRLIDTGGGGDL